MYGWRARIGVIVSPPNTVVEGEFPRTAPEGVSLHVARLGRPKGHRNSWAPMWYCRPTRTCPGRPSRWWS